MRLMKVAATIGVAVAMAIGAAGTGSAAQNDYSDQKVKVPAKDSGVSAQRTNGHSFWEINASGELNYWYRSGESFERSVRGSGWQNTRQITSLNANVFLEIKPDYRLARWTWTGNGFIEEIVGTGWQPARVITGIDDNRFLEIKQDGTLTHWTFTPNGLSASNVGAGWQNARTIAGLGGPQDNVIDFMEIKNTGAVSEWYSTGGPFEEWPFGTVDFSDVRLIAGMDADHFVFIPNDGTLWEFALVFDETEQQWYWIAAQRGAGWGGTRLIG